MFSGHLLGGEDHRGAAVGERAAVVELERIGHVSGFENLLDGDLLLELRLRVQRAVPVVLDGHRGHLGLGGPVLLHVRAGDQRENPGKGQAEGLFPDRVGGVREVLGRLGRGDVQHTLGAADQDDVRDPCGDLHDAVTERGVRAGAGGLEPGGRDRGNPQDRGGLRSGVELVLGLPADDVAVVQGLDGACRDVGVRQRLARRLGEELGRGAVVQPELRDSNPDHRNPAHEKPS